MHVTVWFMYTVTVMVYVN